MAAEIKGSGRLRITSIGGMNANNGDAENVRVYTREGKVIEFYSFVTPVEATLKGGYGLRHGLIGSGVYASHGYERSHIDGVYNPLKVLAGYLAVN